MQIWNFQIEGGGHDFFFKPILFSWFLNVILVENGKLFGLFVISNKVLFWDTLRSG